MKRNGSHASCSRNTMESARGSSSQVGTLLPDVGSRITRFKNEGFHRAEQEADTRHVVMVLRDLELEKSTIVVTPVAMRSKSEELLLLAGAKTFERRGYQVVLVMNYFVSGTRGEESHDRRPRGTQRCLTLLARATSCSDRV